MVHGLVLSLRSMRRGRAGHLIAAFSVGWIFMYTDRAVFSPVLNAIGSDFQVTAGRLGLIGSVFYLAYAAFQIPVGLAAEKVGRRRMLVVGFALFGISTMLSGLATSFTMLLILGFITGLGQATYYPIQYSIAAEAIPAESRTLSLAVINGGMAVGIGGGTLFAAFIAFQMGLGWRFSLIATGLLTVGIAFWLGRVVEEPRGRVNTANTGTAQSLRNVMRRDQVGAYIAGFCSLYGFFALLTWLPYYLERYRDMSDFSAGAVSTIAAWVSIPAALIAAYASDTVTTHRRLLLIMFPIAALAIGALPFLSAPAVIVLLVVYGAFGKLATDPLLVAYLAERTHPDGYPLTYAVFNFAGMMGSVIAPVATGTIVELTGEMTLGFVIAAALLLIGALALWLIAGEISREISIHSYAGVSAGEGEVTPQSESAGG